LNLDLRPVTCGLGLRLDDFSISELEHVRVLEEIGLGLAIVGLDYISGYWYWLDAVCK